MKKLKKQFLEELKEKISSENLKKLELFLKNEILKIEKEKNNLEKKNEEIIISDLDDTIFSTFERFIYYPELKLKRWNIWNKYIIENIWFNDFIKNFYKNKTFPKTVSSKLKEKKDLILTAWIKELQIMKIKELWLDNLNYIITEKAEEKIFALIKYIIFDLKFLPKKIIIYEDRPHFFIYFKEFLENFLETQIEIIYVEMDWNEFEPKFKKINF